MNVIRRSQINNEWYRCDFTLMGTNDGYFECKEEASGYAAARLPFARKGKGWGQRKVRTE